MMNFEPRYRASGQVSKFFDGRRASGTGPEATRKRFDCAMFCGGIR